MYIIGIDEAGRGALAGPVVVAAVIVPTGFYPRSASLTKLKDSKRLSPTARAAWLAYIKEHPEVSFTTARVYPRGIENKNIANAANLAAKRAFLRLLRDTGIERAVCRVLLDGSLYLGDPRESSTIAKTIVRGDQRFVAIKLASIVAKVTRDAYMTRLDERLPDYAFRVHKGYGTALHRELIGAYGAAEVHRKTFLEKILNTP